MLPLGLDANIRIQMLGDCVPEYEERETARFCLIPWPTWERTPYEKRVRMVAHRRIHNAIEDHGRDASRKF